MYLEILVGCFLPMVYVIHSLAPGIEGQGCLEENAALYWGLWQIICYIGKCV